MKHCIENHLRFSFLKLNRKIEKLSSCERELLGYAKFLISYVFLYFLLYIRGFKNSTLSGSRQISDGVTLQPSFIVIYLFYWYHNST